MHIDYIQETNDGTVFFTESSGHDEESTADRRVKIFMGLIKILTEREGDRNGRNRNGSF